VAGAGRRNRAVSGDRALDPLFARNDDGKYDAPAPTVRRAKDDFDGLHDILGDHLEEMSQTQREVIDDEFLEGRTGAKIAARRGIRMNSCDTQRRAAFLTRRDSMTTVADLSTVIDLPNGYGRIEEMSKRDAARKRRRATGKKENRSSSRGDRSNFEADRSSFEGDASNSRRDAEQNVRAGDVSVALPPKS